MAPPVVFLWLVRRHDQVIRSRDAAIRGIAFYERGLARLEDRWVGTGEPGDRFRDDGHVYANDLDLFGRAALFELLSLARTRTGEEALARWLTSPADASEIQARQDAVEELSSARDLREQLALAGADVRASVQTDRLLDWAESPMSRHRGLRVFTWIFTAAVFVAIPYVAITATWWALGAVAALQAVVFGRLREAMNAVLSAKDSGQAGHTEQRPRTDARGGSGCTEPDVVCGGLRPRGPGIARRVSGPDGETSTSAPRITPPAAWIAGHRTARRCPRAAPLAEHESKDAPVIGAEHQLRPAGDDAAANV